MKAVLFVGIAIGLAASEGWAAEMGNAVPLAYTTEVGAPTALTPTPASRSVGAPLLSRVPPSRPRWPIHPTRYPATVYNPYHPHWVVEVFGR